MASAASTKRRSATDKAGVDPVDRASILDVGENGIGVCGRSPCPSQEVGAYIADYVTAIEEEPRFLLTPPPRRDSRVKRATRRPLRERAKLLQWSVFHGCLWRFVRNKRRLSEPSPHSRAFYFLIDGGGIGEEASFIPLPRWFRPLASRNNVGLGAG